MMNKFSSRGRLTVIVLLAVTFALAAACKKNANTGNTATSNGGGTTTTTTTTTGGAGTAASGPTAALRAYYEAGMKKDVATAKKYLSTGSIKVLEDGARNMGMTLDEAMQQNAQQSASSPLPEFANERISGDTATVDIKAQGETLTMHMVKEGGEWKLAMDKVLEDLKRKSGSGGATTTQTQPEGGDDEDDHGGHEEK
jgi:hypothetical protein